MWRPTRGCWCGTPGAPWLGSSWHVPALCKVSLGLGMHWALAASSAAWCCAPGSQGAALTDHSGLEFVAGPCMRSFPSHKLT